MKKANYNVQTGELQTVELTDEEIAAIQADYDADADLRLESFKQERNRRLAETDYFALSDVTMSDEMQTYRQALRDLPANTSDPANPVWPTKPGD